MNVSKKLNFMDFMFGNPMTVISDCLRGFLIPAEGYEFIGCDLSAIEARVLAWLAGEKRVLDIFNGHGKIYEATAASIYHCDIDKVTKQQRFVGKVADLALGYGGGKGAFKLMAKGYGVEVSDEEAEKIKIAWRAARPNTVQLWRQLEDAAKDAIYSPGLQYNVANRIKFKKAGSFLWCQLPSDRVLCYPYAKLEQKETPWGEMRDSVTYLGVSSLTNKWESQKTYGGSLAENVTQAIARDVLVQGMFRLEAAGYPVIMHVHDEVLCEVPKGFGSVKEMERLMTISDGWMEGLPLKAEGWRGFRYQK